MIDSTGLFSNLITTDDFLTVIKLVILALEALYAAFAFIVLRQTALMNKTFQTDAGLLLNLFSKIHFFAVVGVFVLSLIIL